MKEVLIFAGTTEGRLVAEHLAKENIRHTVCVATEYGVQMLEEHPLRTVRQGRMTQEEMKELICSGSFAAVVDATHPYAELVTENIKLAISGTRLPYFRIEREADNMAENEKSKIRHFSSAGECARALEKTQGNILLTTGSKELSVYCASESLRKRLYVRILPAVESLQLCEKQGIKGSRIIAMQGPFTVEMNEAMLRQYHIAHLVTKESGASGGYGEKLEAASRADASIWVIDRPVGRGI